MARDSFRPSPRDRNMTHNLATDDLPERVTVDLDDKDPGNFTVVEVDDTPEADRGKPRDVDRSILEQEEDLRGVSKNVQKRIDRFKFEVETHRRGKEAAERERDAAIEAARLRDAEIARLRQAAERGTSALADSMTAERESRITDAKRRLAAAHADGDAEAIAAATADLTQASAELIQIKANTPKKPAAAQQQPPAPQPQRQAAPTIAPNVVAWLAHNDGWFNKDKEKTDFAMSIHRTLVARGVEPSSDTYTAELDKGLKTMYPDHQPFSGSRSEADNGGDNGERSAPRRTNAVEPGSRENADRPANPRTVELTSSQLAIAKQLNLTPQQYAASLLKYNAGRSGA